MKRTCGLLALILLASSTGCAKFPYGMSLDRHNFISTPHQPLTVSVKDTITGEELLRVDIPVYKQLLIDFEHKHDWTPAQTPGLPAESVTWEIIDADRLMAGGMIGGDLKNRLELPGNPVKIVVDVRDDESVAGVPTYQPAGTAATASDTPKYKPVEAQPDPQPDPQPAATNPKRGPAIKTYPDQDAKPATKPIGNEPQGKAPWYTPTEKPADQPKPKQDEPKGDDLEGALD
jgi:outer membrane biosynthesis protein TonB